MTASRIPSPLFSESAVADIPVSSRAKTIATRLPKAEMEAVETAATAAKQSPSVWLREAAIAHLKRPVPKKKSLPDPTLLAEILALRSIVVNLLSAVAVDLPKETMQRILTQADGIKQGKAEEILRRLEDETAPKTDGK